MNTFLSGPDQITMDVISRTPILAILISIFIFFPAILAQQPYIGLATTACDSRDNTTSVLGYTCNGLRSTCQAYLTFRAQPPYASVAAISDLLSVNSSQLSEFNAVSEDTVFPTDRTVLIPVTCSCSGQLYQINVSYVIQPNDTYLGIANNTFQGLTTCQALQVENSVLASDLSPGQRIIVPLRCACPTQNQTNDGTNYLLSFLVTWNQFVSAISALFGVDMGRTLAANGLSETNSIIQPFTTLLVPLQDPPTPSQVAAPQPPPPPSGTSLPPPPAPTNNGSSKTWIYAVVGVVCGLAFAALAGWIIVRVRQKPKSNPESGVPSQSFESAEKPLNKEPDEESQDFLETLSSIAQSLKVYPFKELQLATQDFSPSSWIKGSVYRGTINGDLAAIKKMNGDVSKEISLLNKINHFNLIRLSGVSFNEGNWYIVYEYASNGPLSDWICNSSGEEKILDWNKRMQIAQDVAAGLNYLHLYTSPSHVHKDLNSSNVLLDQDFRAKIMNFGLARSAEGQEGEFALTRHIIGTKGYMAPEYLENGIVSPKLDVYAFGVLLLEILTGKEVSMLYEEVNVQQLSDVVTPVLLDGEQNLRNLMDPSLQGKYPANLAFVLFRLIDSCLKKDPSDRPNMDDICQSLARISASSLSGQWAISVSEQPTMPR